ncbi:MAG: TolC family protein [Bacillota bacterium]|nr:TolC family protein [Bacillota bacterium]
MNKKLILGLVLMMLISSIPVMGMETTTESALTEEENQEEAVEEEILQLTIEDAAQLAIENSWDIQTLDRNIRDVNKAIGEQKDLQDDMEALLKLPLVMYDMMDIDITDDFISKLLIKRGYGIKAAENNKLILEETKKQTLEALEIGAKSAYYQVLIAEKTMQLQEQLLKKAEQHRGIANVKYENGVATKLVKLQADSAYISAKSDYQDAEDTLKIKYLELNNTLGLDFDKKVELVSDVGYTPTEEIDLQTSIQAALENRSDIKKLKAKLELQEVETGAYKSYYTPALRQYKNAEEKLLEAEHAYEQSFKDVELDVRTKYLELLKAERALNNMTESVAIARESERVSRLFYEYDLATLTDVIDAETALSQAEIGKYQLLISYNIAKMMFENSYDVGLPSGGGSF